MSTKFIGISAVVAGCLTAAVAGYVVLREPAQVALVAGAGTADGQPAVEAAQAVLPAQVPPGSESVTAPLPAAPNAPVVARQARPAPQTPAPGGATPPAPEPETTPDLVAAPAPAAAAAVPAPAPVAQTPPQAAEPQRYVPEFPTVPPQAAHDPLPEFDEVLVERNSVIGIRLDYAISTRTARVEDRVSATVSRDVTVQGRVAIPSGSTLEGTVAVVDRGGKFRDRPRLGLRFDTLVLTDGTRLAVRTDTIYREGDSPTADATARVGGGAVAGAIIGAVLGGKKGAAIGSAAGAAGGAATVMAGDGDEVALRAGAPLTVRLTGELTVLVKRH